VKPNDISFERLLKKAKIKLKLKKLLSFKRRKRSGSSGSRTKYDRFGGKIHVLSSSVVYNIRMT
jgi:hypothetical protein